MNTLQLEKILTSDRYTSKYFEGVLAADELPRYVLSYPSAYVVNTDSSDEAGKHWLAFFFDSDGIAEFFDSYGGVPGDYDSNFQRFFKTNSSFVITNPRQLQQDTSAVCGAYVVYYLYKRCRKEPMNFILSNFTKDKGHNDYVVSKFVRDRFSHLMNCYGGQLCNRKI